jgi:hypothetical protein
MLRALECSEPWGTDGLVSEAALFREFDRFAHERDDDPSTEHYRWRLAQDVVSELKTLPDSARRSALVAAAISDHDRHLGESIVIAVAKRLDLEESATEILRLIPNDWSAARGALEAGSAPSGEVAADQLREGPPAR